jgi:hypothetical protein
MEVTKNEVEFVTQAINAVEQRYIVELNDVQLALVGGGIAELVPI